MIEQSEPTTRQQFKQQQLTLLQQSTNNTQKTILQAQLNSKVEIYKKIQTYKQMLLQKLKALRSRGKELEAHAKNLSDSQKKQYPIFIVRPSFIAEKFITKQIKNAVLQLGKKFNKLNDYHKIELTSYFLKHKSNIEFTKQILKLLKQEFNIDNDITKKINKQKIISLNKQLEVDSLKKYVQKLIFQKQYLIESRKSEKQTYDNLKVQIDILSKDVELNSTSLVSQKQKYLEDFNVAVCRQRIHKQFLSEFKENKLAFILNDSFSDVSVASKKQHTLKGYLRNKGAPMMLGKIVSYKTYQQRALSVSVAPTQKIKRHQKRLTTKSGHTQSTALKTKQSRHSLVS